MQMISDCAVPGFFAISAFLFFQNFDMSKYQNKLRTRVKSLMIPYLVFSFLGVLLEIAMEFVFSKKIEISFIEALRGCFTREYNRPLWFLLILFEFVLIAPAIWFFIQKYGKKGAICGSLFLLAINLCLVKTTYVSLFYWLPLFVLFSYIGIAAKEGKTISIPWYYGLALIPLAFFYNYYGVDINHSNVYFLYRMIAGCAVFILGGAFIWKPFNFEKYTMFVFCSHWLVNRLVLFIPSKEYLSFVRVVIIFALCFIIAWVMQRVVPRLYSLITGAR